MDDDELLREYVRSESQSCFRELVERHLPMVYSTARRMVGDAQMAEDLAQAVFATLAQKAASLDKGRALGGWLYNTTRNLAKHAVRTEKRRRMREEAAVIMQALNVKSEPNQILEHLDPAMAELDENERDVLVLHFLEARTLREVGRQFGISEDAARMRVHRALDRLRGVFAQQGITVSAAVLSVSLGATVSEAVPAGLAASVTNTALAVKAAAAVGGTAVAPAAVTTASWLKATAIVGGIAAVVTVGTLYLAQNRRIQELQSQNKALLAQRDGLVSETSAFATKTQNLEALLQRMSREQRELTRLRGEVTQLRDSSRRQNAAAPQLLTVVWALNPQVLASNPPVVLIRPTPDANLSEGPSGMISSEHGTIALKTHLRNVFSYAYDFPPTGLDRILMPEDYEEQWFDFIDTLPQGGKEAMRKLLKTQFGLTAKRETRSVQGMSLKRTQNASPGLKASTASAGKVDGSLVGNAGLGNETAAEHDRIRGDAVSISALAAQLATRLGVPVLDETGLTELYHYDILVPHNDSTDQINTVLSEQLGLMLVPVEQKQSSEFLIVERPQQQAAPHQ